jgi:hypothetical protein
VNRPEAKFEDTKQTEQPKTQHISKERLERFKRAFESKWLKEKIKKSK